MRRSLPLILACALSACSWGMAPADPPIPDPVDTVTAWRLTETASGALDVALVAGEHVIELVEVEGRCAPAAELPFTEVDGQRTFAALACRNPEGEPFDLALVELMAPEGDWPLPVAFGIVSTRDAGEGQIMMRSFGAAPIPLGIAPVAPTVPEGATRPAAIAPSPEAPSDEAPPSP